MPIHNSDISDIFNKVADLLEINGANQFRVRAYRDAARTIDGLSERLADAVEKNEDNLTDLPGIGKDLAGKIREIVKTGQLTQLEDLKKDVPAELAELLNISGLGPKKVQALYKELGVTGKKDLREAAEKGKVKELDGFGEKTQKKILEELQEVEEEEKRFKLFAVEEMVNSLVEYLEEVEGVNQITVAGSYRRRRETVGDIDILITHEEDTPVMDRFTEYEDVVKVVSRGKTRSTVVLRSGLQVDLRAVSGNSYGAALHYFTGSKSHNIAIRKIGVKRGLKINEYGIYKGEDRVGGENEEEVFEKVGLVYIEPELRENRGEIEAAKEKKLPGLIQLTDIKGDLHVHTKITDGKNTLKEMAKAASELGYEYLAITEHSKRVSVASGLDEKKLAGHIEEIDRLNQELDGITLLKGVEVDVLEDGSLDLSDDILKELDLRVCSLHYNNDLSRKKQTERILRAMDNPWFNILGHPTGRMINERKPYDVDIEKVMETAKEKNCILELNAHPDRLDLNDHHLKTAREIGVKIAISTDAHSVSDLRFMRFGIGQGRRGWLEKEDVINTRTLTQLKKLLKR